MRRFSVVAVTITVAFVGFVRVASVRAEGEKTLVEWRFDADKKWNGWQPSRTIRDVTFDGDEVAFATVGSDPQILSPPFELPNASNRQWVVLDLECSGPGTGEFFYTNKTTGRYGGLEPRWMVPLTVPGAGRQSVTVWPFWGGLERVVRVRFDPPSGVRCRLQRIRIVEPAGEVPLPAWDFRRGAGTWRSMHAARIDSSDIGLRVCATRPQAVIISPVEPFDAARRSVLRLDAKCAGEHAIGLYWATTQDPGLYGEPIRLDGTGGGKVSLDLRRFPAWRGTVTHLAIGFGSLGNETLTLRSLAIEENDPARPWLRARYLGFERAINRPGRPARVKAVLEHAGGPPMPAGHAVLAVRGDVECPGPAVPVPAIRDGERITLTHTVIPKQAGQATVRLTLNGQTFTRSVRIDESLDSDSGATRGPDGYDVPPPRPVKTSHDIGIYYFPGWSPDQLNRWSHQQDFPERDPVLGWYAEGRPEVADWHIKWAVENGISFFVYDWYWRDGKEVLGAGLNDGLLEARYCEQLKFALMWANHKPFADHTPEQLLTVTDYWIEHYFRRPNYLTVDGKPYVSFFDPNQLVSSLGSEEKIAAAFETMRRRVREAGLPGLHIGACGGTTRSALESHKRAGYDSVTAYNYGRTASVLPQSLYRAYMLGHETVWKSIDGFGVLPYMPLLNVGWESRPWHGPRARQRFARRTEDFAESLGRLKAHLEATGGRMAILEAWNEWGEGSYIEPNVEFGFKDLEAIRSTFGTPGSWPTNIAPDDVGLGGRYDLRRSTNEQASADANSAGARIALAGVHPAVRSGIELFCKSDRIVITPGEAADGDRKWRTKGGTVFVEPAEIVDILRFPMTVVTGEVKKWHGGNRLKMSLADRRNLLPGSFVPGSLQIVDPAHPRVKAGSPNDLIVDETWGAFSVPAGSRLKTGNEYLARYRMSLRRIDALILDADGTPRLVRGLPSPDCPEPPEPPDGALHLANVYRPFNARVLRPHQVYVCGAASARTGSVTNTADLAPVLAKLRAGRPVTVVCWGDSVTVGGDASTPATTYVGRFKGLLKKRFPKAGIRVVNAGIGGSNTHGRFPNFQKEVLDHKPDLVTLEFVNDMGFPEPQLQQRYTKILKRVREAGAALILITPHFTMPEWMKLPNGRGPDRRYAVAFLRRFAAEEKVPLADASRRWEQLEAIGIPYETLLKNGINHPDDRGHLIFAEELMRFFPKR